MKKPFVFIILFVLTFSVSAQDILKFGKENIDEVREEFYPLDSTAKAAYLYKYRNSYYQYFTGSGFQLVTEIHEKIKIYDQDALEYATQVVSLYNSRGSYERISDLKGYTYNWEPTGLKKEKLGKESIFKEEASDNRTRIRFTLPNAKAGSVLEYKYKVTSPFYYSIDEFVFQEDIPTKKVIAILNILEWFRYNQMQRGVAYLKPTITPVYNNTLETNSNKIVYELDNIPALVEEDYVSNMDNYRLGMKFEIASVQIPGQTFTNYAKSWDDVVKTISKADRFGSELKRDRYFRDELPGIIANAASPMDKMNTILAYVKQKVKWDEGYGVFCAKGVRQAYEEGSGNSGEINLMLVAMLRAAGLNAQPVLLSTRSNGVPLFPTLNGLNFVIASAEVDGKQYLMDATDPFSTPNILPVRDLNWIGQKMNSTGGTEMVPLTPSIKAVETTMVNATLSDTGELEGSCNSRFTGHYAYLLRKEYLGGTEDSYLEELEKDNGEIEIDDFAIKQVEDLNKPLSQSYSFYKENVLETISGKKYLNPLLFLTTSNNPFTADTREYAVELGFPQQDRYMVNIELPAGYSVESLPAPVRMALPEGGGSFQYSVSQVGQKIQLQCNFSLDKAVYGPSFYPMLKEFFNQMIVKNQEKIVLVKT